MDPQKSFSLPVQLFVLFAAIVFMFALMKTAAPTTAQSSQSKRLLDDRVPSHLPIKVKIKKEKEQEFQDLKNERWMSDFELELKNTGDRPIYALSVAWMLEEVTMPDGSHYGSMFRYGRSEFITNPSERPKPEDIPIQPGETHVFKFSLSSVEGWESFAKENNLPQPKSIQIFFNWVSFGDGTGWEGPNGQRFDRKSPLAFDSSAGGNPINCKQPVPQREPALPIGFSMMPAKYEPAFFWAVVRPQGIQTWRRISVAREHHVRRLSGDLDGVTVQASQITSTIKSSA